jgi:hypothetical protein
MKSKKQLIKEIERLPESLIDEVHDFVAFVEDRKGILKQKGRSWSDFSLSTGAFDFWNNSVEIEYSLEDIKA